VTALLHVTGGPANPFSVFYLVLMMVAAVALTSAWTLVIAILGVSGYAVLFVLPPAAVVPAGHEAHDFAAHLRAMWVALTLAAALTAYVVTRLRAMIAERDRTLSAVREAPRGRPVSRRSRRSRRVRPTSWARRWRPSPLPPEAIGPCAAAARPGRVDRRRCATHP
jgi:two-component system sensor histidine kinase RegB